MKYINLYLSYILEHRFSSLDYRSVNPYFHETFLSIAVGTVIDYHDWTATLAAQDQMTEDMLPRLENITPDGAAYLNEADFQLPNFQDTLYGDNYFKLLSIKHKYDPTWLFYARTAVVSEGWMEQSDGRLCKAAR